MESLILLATVMAVFGVFGYLRGIKSTLVTTASIWLGLVLVSRFSSTIALAVNGLNYAARFALAGGLGALGGSGDKGAAINQVFERMGAVKSLISADGTGPGYILIFLALMGVGLLLGALKALKAKSSPLSLVLGLLNGYVVSAYLLRRGLPEAGILLPLPAGLLGSQAPLGAIPAPAGPSVTGSAVAKLAAGLTQLATQGRIAILIAVLIAIFVLLAVRTGSRTSKKG